MRWSLRWSLFVLLLLWGASARAETQRVAIVIGNNAGNSGRDALHYAENDAGKFARVLIELGNVAPEDLALLQGKGASELRAAMDRTSARIRELRALPGMRVVLVFYYSGHSDGLALELGAERYTFASLRQWLRTTDADVRLVIVDSCKSGALLATKGGHKGPGFEIRLDDKLSAEGEVFLTSSAADEIALESREIGGSFFTHYLLSGLRGAADRSGDGRVTLAEAYQYTYSRTVSSSGATIAGAQHPHFDYRLAGQGELTLTQLETPLALLTVPPGYARYLIRDVRRDQVVAELELGAPPTIAVMPGRYAVYAWRDDQLLVANVNVGARENRAISDDELEPTTSPTTFGKGGGVSRREATGVMSSPQLRVTGGATSGVATGLGLLPGMTLDLTAGKSFGPALSLSFASDRGDGFRETHVLGGVGVWIARDVGPVLLQGSLLVGGGRITQTIDDEGASGSTLGSLHGQALVALPVGARWSVHVLGRFGNLWLKKNGDTAGELHGVIGLGVGANL